MEWVSAPNIEDAPLEHAARRFLQRISGARAAVERFLERERGQLPLWLVACFGGGIAAWFWIGEPSAWEALGLACLGGPAMGSGGRSGRALAWAGVALAVGCCWAWLRADQAVAYRYVAQTLADASKAGLTKVGFISEPDAVR